MRSFIAILSTLLVASAFIYTGSQQSILLGDIALCAVITFGVQWLIFIPSFMAQNEHFFDLTGSLTYISITGFGLYHSAQEPVQLLLAFLVSVWALRLGTFLFRRVRKNQGDSRFEKKNQLGWFLTVWTIQGLWVFLTSAAAMTVITMENVADLNALSLFGVLVWILGFGFEVMADHQKTVFRSNPQNKGRFIQTGVWKYSRHPNYFGEIILWLGIALIALPSLQGLGYFSLVSPLFVYILLTRISGITILEEQGLERWGAEEEYQKYLQHTPSLIPLIGMK